MKKLYCAIIVLSIIFCFVSFALTWGSNDILSEEDYSLEKEDAKSCTISIPESNFCSHNTWRCFNVSDVEIKTSEVDYDGWHEVPSIDAHANNFIFSYDIDPDIRWDVDRILDFWEDLTRNIDSICIYGVYLQEIDEKHELWYIELIKTQNGYWRRDDFLDFLSPDDKEYNVEALKRWGVFSDSETYNQVDQQ